MLSLSPDDRAASISFRRLRLFASVGRLGSFRKASEDCNISQPAVTQALTKLEEQVGVPLLLRRANGSYLNDSGAIFYHRVKRFFDKVESALTELAIPGGGAAASVFAKRLSRAKIRGLIAIVENPSLEQAAAALDLTASSLQRTAHELEGTLQKQIFHRTSDGITVTQAGAQFGYAMKLAMQEIELGIIEIEVARGNINSKISVGAMLTGGSVLLASALDEFVAAFPSIDVRIINESSAAMLRSLRAGDVDFVLGLLPPNLGADLVSEPLARTPYEIAARRGHRLLDKGQVTMQDLLSCEWVVGSAGSSRQACFDHLFADRPAPNAPIKTSSLPIIRHLLERSDRLTIMTTYELLHETETLAPVPFIALDPVPAIGIIMRAGWHPTELHTNLMDLARRRMVEFKKTAPV
jgi:LysR family transcriptional regulator of gallate degradation